MYTAYFFLRYDYLDFRKDFYISKQIIGAYDPLNDPILLSITDTKTQLEMDAYFGDNSRRADSSDITLYLISYNEFMAGKEKVCL